MRKKRFTIKVGPLGLSLAAAAITATAFAAISLADSGSSGTKDAQSFQAPAPPGGGPRVFFHDNLSEADRQKMEEFRQCMEDNGAPAPPEPSEIDPSNPPKPPSEADQAKLKQAWEACSDKLPEALRKAGPPQLHTEECGPPPGAPGFDERGKKENQSDSSTSSSGASS